MQQNSRIYFWRQTGMGRTCLPLLTRALRRSTLLALAASALFLTGTQKVSAQPQPSAYRVRIAYIIPSDRQPQSRYEDKAAVLMSRIQTFYADQMERSGFGRMTFEVESGSDGKPAVHLVHSKLTAAVFADIGHAKYVAGKYWDHAFQAVIDAGYQPDAPGEVWLCFVEAQEQLADGSVHNDTTQANGRFGNGFALCSGLELALGGDPELIHDHRPYDGLVVPAIGPHPLHPRQSFPSYQGVDVSSLDADYISATAHELGHCFLLQHCYLNDATQCGNLMGNGFRGWRGYFMPEKFPTEDTRLDRPSAVMLSLCPFFKKPAKLLPYSPPPAVTIETPPGDMVLDHGTLRITFTASEPKGPGIAMATLENGQGRDNVGIVAWKEFDGKSKSITATFETNTINPGMEDTWRVAVLDTIGNVTYQTLKLTAPRYGVGPSPFIEVQHSQVRVGASVSFHGEVRRPMRFKYEWDFGDGATAEGPQVEHVFTKPGIYEVKLKATDPGGRVGKISQYLSVTMAPAVDR